jgi:hypothetical protein
MEENHEHCWVCSGMIKTQYTHCTEHCLVDSKTFAQVIHPPLLSYPEVSDPSKECGHCGFPSKNPFTVYHIYYCGNDACEHKTEYPGGVILYSETLPGRAQKTDYLCPGCTENLQYWYTTQGNPLISYFKDEIERPEGKVHIVPLS